MSKVHNSSALAKQVAEALHMNQEDNLRLYAELSRIHNGPVKDALDALSLALKGAAGDKSCTVDLAENYPKNYAQMMDKILKEKENKPTTHKYVALIRSKSVRDAQYEKTADSDYLDDDAWVDANEMPLFLKIVEAETPTRAQQMAAAYASVDESVIELIPI